MAEAAPAADRAERWHVDAGDAALATLHIPADAQRERRFEIACAMTVKVTDGATAWHEMTVLANGAQQWKRRITSHGGVDGLDYRFARSVAVGQSLVLKVSVACRGALRRSLVVEADEIVSPTSPAR